MIGRSRIPAVALFAASLATSFVASTLLTPPLLAQNASTSLRGTVTDSTGASIPGATVTISNQANGTTSTAKSNAQGSYAFQQVTPGKYTITVEMAGFAKYTVNSELLVAQPATINVTLGVTSEAVTVDVSAATQTINTTDATIGNAVDNETIMELPSEARNPTTLLATQPGVLFFKSGDTDTDSTESRNGVVSGARSDQTNITLDGVDNNNQIAPAAFQGVLFIPLDATEEFRVTTSNANADTGRSSGGQVNLVTRAGTNKIHGAVYDYNRTNFGQANDFFNKNAQLQTDSPNVPGKLIYNVFGGSLGGPIKKDRIFLFGNYEGERRLQGSQTTRTIPSDALKAGNLTYTAADGSTVVLNSTQVASMDLNCSGNGTCPQGAGDNPSSLALFATYPTANTTSAGDGFNTLGYTFSSPIKTVNNVYTTRLDFSPWDKLRFYVRASMQNDAESGASQFPGLPPNTKSTDNSKGITGNATWSIKSNLTNSVRYGFIRQSIATTGSGHGDYTTFRSFDTPEGMSRSTSTVVPTHNFVDDLSWTKGKHTVQVGANYRKFDYQNSTDANSYNGATASYSWMLNSGYANKHGTFDPEDFGLPKVQTAFNTNYNNAVTALAGLTNEETDHFNYLLSGDGKTGSILGDGVAVKRDFKTNEFEYYIQDSWKPISNLTITAGIRHSILQTPYEANGQQVQPTINIHDWFITRAQQAAQGNSVQPEISFAPSGKARGGKPFYPMNWGNIAPRLALSFSPSFDDSNWMSKLFGGAGKSTIRASFGMYYDHYGEGLVTNYSRHGSYSLSSSLTNPASTQTADTTPRFTGLHHLPGLIDPSAGAATINYPQTPSDDVNTTGFAITNGLDDRIKTPYSETFSFGFQREIKGGFTFEADYVGRLGRHLLQQLDLAQPLNLVDKVSGSDYYTAATTMAKYIDQGLTDVPAIPYFENMFPDAAGLDYYGDGAEGNSATQNIYNDAFAGNRGNETQALNDMDEYCYPGCGNGQYGRYWPLQYSSLYVTSSDGTSNYNSLQVMLRHSMSHNFSFDVSYTLSKSLDIGSDSESNPTSSGNSYGFILDGFNPRKNYAPSDFDTRHIITGDWVAKLPVGRGQHFLGNAPLAVDSLLGGWEVSGLFSASSGLPYGITDGFGWGTNWEYSSYMVQTGPVKTKKTFRSDGLYQIFNPDNILANTRVPYPGEAGERNFYRGDGYFDIDMGVHKVFRLGDRTKFTLAGEAFNLTNSTRFDIHSIYSSNTDDQLIGTYTSSLTGARRMQFSGRFDF